MRLIDADKLYEDLADKLEWLMGYGDDVYLAVGGNIRCAIADQTDVYDLDKVVEQLEADKIHTFDGCINKRYAIEIVKAGGADAEH